MTAPNPTPQTGTICYIWRPALHFHAGRNGRAIRSIILHATEGHEVGDLDTLINGGGRQVSVQWYVTRKGKIIHMVQDCDTANHAGATIATMYSNSCSIGIEQERISPEDYPQVQTTANLCAFLMQKHGLNLEIRSHAYVAAPHGRKTDPLDFPWDIFHDRLMEALKITWRAEEAA